ncbi:hypothetical protein [Streptomyces misionensis]|uniref:hypothetical protein n=1 Tax=Streptomyces misionensis TaxID=67331 RepID=UPI0033ABCF76
MIDALPWPWPWPGGGGDGGGGGPAPEPVISYVQYDDGTLAKMTTGPGIDVVLSRPGRLITSEEYDALSAAMTQAHDAKVQAMRDADDARKQNTYRDLVAAGIPDATARDLSGYEGPAKGQAG